VRCYTYRFLHPRVPVWVGVKFRQYHNSNNAPSEALRNLLHVDSVPFYSHDRKCTWPVVVGFTDEDYARQRITQVREAQADEALGDILVRHCMHLEQWQNECDKMLLPLVVVDSAECAVDDRSTKLNIHVHWHTRTITK